MSGAVSLREADRAGIEEDALCLCAELRSFAKAMCEPATEIIDTLRADVSRVGTRMAA